uniref:SCP domain-containing protein n=1 Tax=Strongyloides venezuelensis TaxID=75913 RepID=A0A0K0G208_STRVS
MFVNHLLYYIIFIILFSNVDVLLGILKKFSRFSESDARTSRNLIPQGRYIKRGESLHRGRENFNYDGEIIHKLDFGNHESKFGRKNSRFLDSFRKKTICKNPRLILLEEFIDRFSLNGRIWQHVWKHSLLYSCISNNRFETLRRNYLTEINLYRKVHGSPPLIVDQYLSGKALHAAINSAALGRWIYSEIRDIRVNFATINIGLSPLLINLWYKENKKYNYKTKDWMSNSFHFSNLVWKRTTQIGIGIAQNHSDLYICLHFYPEGNQKFKFKDNVSKAKYYLVNYRSLIRE